MTQPDEQPLRSFLLGNVLAFVLSAKQIDGVSRIALVGSLATPKPNPKDADVLVTVNAAADLERLARSGRTLKGKAQTRNAGADIFLADEQGTYLGRTCHWRECTPGIRASCRALHCGKRTYLSDDLQIVTLGRELIAAPPAELWPQVVRRQSLPADVEQFLLQPLASQRGHGISPTG